VKIRFYIDPDTDQPHIYNHAVREDEVEDVLRKPGEDRPGREGARIAIGKTNSGRPTRQYSVGFCNYLKINANS
jgi:hypothetical protein